MLKSLGCLGCSFSGPQRTTLDKENSRGHSITSPQSGNTCNGSKLARLDSLLSTHYFPPHWSVQANASWTKARGNLLCCCASAQQGWGLGLARCSQCRNSSIFSTYDLQELEENAYSNPGKVDHAKVKMLAHRCLLTLTARRGEKSSERAEAGRCCNDQESPATTQGRESH